MADEAAKLFPYPDDDPHVISSIRGGFETFAKHLHTAAGNITSDTSVIGGKGWSGNGSAAAKTEITGTAHVVGLAAGAMSDTKDALGPYATAIHDARHDVDGIRKNWRTEHAAHVKAINDINNSDKTSKQKESDRTTENQAWNGLSYGHTVQYGNVMSTLDGKAAKVHDALEKIASHIGKHKVGAGADTNMDIQLAVTDSLPMLHKQLADQDAKNAADLINKAAHGDKNAAKELAAKYGDEVDDPYFATALMNKIGPKGLVELPAQMAKWMHDHDNSSTGDRADMARQNAAVLRFLSGSLATATNDTNEPHVSQSWVQQLEQQGRAEHDIDGNTYDGYWGLGQIMQAAGKKPPYGTTFLRDVGRDMVSWDRQHHKGPKSQDINYSGPYNTGYSGWDDSPGTPDDGKHQPNSDPLIGLMHAASTNAQGAQDIFDYTPKGQDSNLDYLLHDRRDRWTDNGAQLGNALQAACVGKDDESISLAERAVNILGKDDKAHTEVKDGKLRFTDGADDLSGLRGSVGNILSAHIDLVNSSLNSPNHPAFDPKNLDAVLVDTSRNEQAFKRILVTQLGWMRNDFDYGAGPNGSVDERIQELAGSVKSDSNTLGHILEGRGLALEADGGDKDDLNKELAGYLKQGIGLVPLPKVPGAGIAADKTGDYLISHLLPTDYEQQATVKAGDVASSTQATVEQMVDAAIIKNHLWLDHHQPPKAGTTWHNPANPNATPVKVDFVDPHTGNVMSPDKMSATQYQHFRQWAQYSGTVPNAEADGNGSGNDGKAQIDRNMGVTD